MAAELRRVILDGNMREIRELASRGVTPDDYALMDALFSGPVALDVFRFYAGIVPEVFTRDVASAAVESRNFAIVRWLASRNPPIFPRFYGSLINHHNDDMIAFLRDRGMAPTHDCLRTAIRAGRLDLLDWMAGAMAPANITVYLANQILQHDGPNAIGMLNWFKSRGVFPSAYAQSEEKRAWLIGENIIPPPYARVVWLGQMTHTLLPRYLSALVRQADLDPDFEFPIVFNRARDSHHTAAQYADMLATLARATVDRPEHARHFEQLSRGLRHLSRNSDLRLSASGRRERRALMVAGSRRGGGELPRLPAEMWHRMRRPDP